MGKALFLVWFSVLGVACRAAWGQGAAPSARELVLALTQSSLADQMGLSSCSSEREDRYGSLVRSLLRQRAASLAELERALDSIEQAGAEPEFATNGAWVVRAYAQIGRQDAFPRLRRMADDRNLARLGLQLNQALAVSLGLTAFVSRADRAGRVFPCNGVFSAGLALDQFVRAWVSDDAIQFEARLGPHARSALVQMLSARTWAALRAELWPGGQEGAVVGYRLPAQGVVGHRPGTTLDTVFTDRLGLECGRVVVTMVESKEGGLLAAYSVDQAELGLLMRMIARCASE